MKADITYDNRYIILSSDYPIELNVMKTAFTREISNAFIIKRAGLPVNTERCFMNEYNMVPIGLWLEMIKVCKKSNIALELSDNLQKYI